MLRNKQAIRAFREILTQMEAAAVRADAIFELMLERGQINKQELEQVIEGAKARQQTRWSQIRAKIDSLLEEETDKPIGKLA